MPISSWKAVLTKLALTITEHEGSRERRTWSQLAEVRKAYETVQDMTKLQCALLSFIKTVPEVL